MNIGTLTGAITLEDQMTSVLAKLDGVLKVVDDSSRKTGTAIDGLRGHMTLAASVGSFLGTTLANLAMRAVSWATNLISTSLMAGARLEQLGGVTRYLGERAGYTIQFVDDLAEKIEKTGITGVQSRDAIVQLISAHIDLKHATELSAIAQNMATISGVDSSTTYGRIIQGITMLNPMLLRGAGFTVSLTTATDAWTKANNRSASSMTGAERQQALLNAVLKEGAEKAGLYGLSMEYSSKIAGSSVRAWGQVSEQIGTVFLPLTNVAIKAWYHLGGAIRDSVKSSQADVKDFMKALAEGLQIAITSIGQFVTVAVPYVISFGKGLADVIKFLWDWRVVLEVVGAVFVGFYVGVGLITSYLWLSNAAMLAYNATLLIFSGTSVVAAGSATALATGLDTVKLALIRLGLVLGAFMAAYELGTWLEKNTKWGRELSDAYEYAALRLQGYSAAQADAMIATDHATEAAQRLVREKNTERETFKLANNAIDDAKVTQEAAAVAAKAYQKEVSTLADSLGSAGLAKEVKKLSDALDALTKRGDISAKTIAAVADKAAELLDKGAKLNPKLLALALSSEKLGFNLSKITKPGLDDFTAGANDAVRASLDLYDAQQDVSLLLQQTTNDELSRFVDKLMDVGEKFDYVGIYADKFARTWRDDAEDILDAVGDMFDGINSKVGQALQILSAGLETVLDKGLKFGERLAAGFATAAAMLSSLLGDTSMSKGKNALVGGLSGAAAGAAIGSILPGVGTAIGAAIGGITGALFGWLSAAAKVREANQKATQDIKDYQTELLKTYGSLDNIRTIGQSLGIDLAGAWGDQSQAGLKHFMGLMDEFKGKMEQLQSALEKYGLTWKDLGQDFKQMNVTMAAEQMKSDFDLMVAAGVPADKAIQSMSGSFNQLIIDAVQTGTKIPEALQPIIEQMIRMGLITDEAARAMLGLAANTMPSLADITAAADRYGLSLDQLGPKVKQLQITEAATQIAADFQMLIAAGANPAMLALSAMGDKTQELVDLALKYGMELPESMKPLLQAMIDAGTLTDASGKKMTDLSKLTFAKDLTKMFDELIAKLNELIDKIVGGVGGALNEITRPRSVDIEVITHTRPEDYQTISRPYAAGGVVYAAAGARILPFTPKGTDTVPAMLTPGERVLSVAQNREYERGREDAVLQSTINMDGMKVGEAIVKVRTRLGLGG
ncbi:MAG: DUF1825 family protein [Sulfuricaulis sp.]|nr:DUF1825 family protein [Sulfuricaulis sp.]